MRQASGSVNHIRVAGQSVFEKGFQVLWTGQHHQCGFEDQHFTPQLIRRFMDVLIHML